MMKILRKYNKQFLAVITAFVLVFWLAGDPLQQALMPNPGAEVLGRDLSGPITRNDTTVAEFNTRIQILFGISWEQEWGQPAATTGEPLETLDWVLLVREAERNGADVSIAESRRICEQGGMTETQIRQRLAQAGQDVTVDTVYAALAEFLKVKRMMSLLQASFGAPEPQLRQIARDRIESSKIQAVTFPAASFADPEESFDEETIKNHFETHKADRPVEGSLTFGYFRDPRVKVQYIHIDPAKIKEALPDDESRDIKQALEYWKRNPKAPEFKRTPEEVAAITDAMPTATDDQGNPLPKPVPALHHETFEQAKAAAIDAVKKQKAKMDADRIAAELTRLLAAPWFAVDAPPDQYKPAPESVKRLEHYTEVIAQLPGNLQYPDAVTTLVLDLKTERELNEIEGIGAYSGLAFQVEGLVEIPKETKNRAVYKSLWETYSRPLDARENGIYLLRVVEVEEGHVPESLDEVRDLVLEDLRTLSGMERARAAAQQFAESARDLGLKEAWEQNTELADKVTPDKGGFVEPPPFARTHPFFEHYIPQIGKVTEEAIDIAFDLAAQGEESSVEVVDLPDVAAVAVLKGLSRTPLYKEDYASARGQMLNDLARRQFNEILFDWVTRKQIRARNKFELNERL